ncbi:MAG: hypothetical protein IKB42_04555 [Clostridia bacterium]|jgi:hypothetical protein|nr:hypothetical protein [Clostridia bacterium]
MDIKEKLKQTLIKKATGYKVEESVCEYGVEEDGVRLLKKKVSTKYYPPDITAINLLLNEKDIDYKDLTDQELEEEKEKILKLLKEVEDGDKEK